MSDDLFSSHTDQRNQPLAYRMSPRSLDEYIGQDHIVGPGRLLRRVIQADRLSSLIFYGPPGTGKTALAKVIARTSKSSFTALNAVLTGVKDLREAIKSAREKRDLYGKRTILFIDEVHRWNKAQQDALLPWVENGTVVLIGATTQNPYFEVNSALVSRSRIFQLKPLKTEDLLKIAQQALQDHERGYGNYRIEFEEGALEHLVQIADGDARSLLNAMELAIETTPDRFPPPAGEHIYISMDAAEQSIQKKAVLYDKEGDYHFDIISAFIKSLRGSDPDAALYWLSRMVHAGEDPHFIFRRMLISASEDVGMADPYALGVVEAAAATFDRVGMPEGRYHLAHAALYLATAPKSNSALGFFDALTEVTREGTQDVPNHLKDANRDAKSFGHGEGYLYPHAYRDHWVAQQYLPTSLQGKIFYRPSNQGYEQSMQLQVARQREAQLSASLTQEHTEVLSYSPPDQGREQWLNRVVANRSATLEAVRAAIFSRIKPARHDRICVVTADDGIILWEALRSVPEGGVTGLVSNPGKLKLLQHYAAQLEQVEQPYLYQGTVQECLEPSKQFEFILGRNYTSRRKDKISLLQPLFRSLSPGGTLLLAEAVPLRAQRLSELLTQAGRKIDLELQRVLMEIEEQLYCARRGELLAWDIPDLEAGAESAGFINITTEAEEIREQRYIRKADIQRWLANSTSPDTLGSYLQQNYSAETAEHLIAALQHELGELTVDWRSTVCFLQAQRSST
ncbi:MAG TPA: AAA family ATPase [Clostridia bacterium]|nr:AAA family ATPase [Clostridia bacterium]